MSEKIIIIKRAIAAKIDKIKVHSKIKKQLEINIS